MEGVTSSLTTAEREALVNLLKKLGRASEDQLSKRGES